MLNLTSVISHVRNYQFLLPISKRKTIHTATMPLVVDLYVEVASSEVSIMTSNNVSSAVLAINTMLRPFTYRSILAETIY